MTKSVEALKIQQKQKDSFKSSKKYPHGFFTFQNYPLVNENRIHVKRLLLPRLQSVSADTFTVVAVAMDLPGTNEP